MSQPQVVVSSVIPKADPLYCIDYFTLKALQVKSGRKLFIQLPERVLDVDECIKTVMESIGFNNPAVKMELKTKDPQETAKFMREFPRPFSEKYLSSPISAGNRLRNVMIVKDPLEMESEELLKIRNSSTYDSVYLFGQKKNTEEANLLCYELKQAGFVFIDAPCFEVK